jgi:hypothetical protein
MSLIKSLTPHEHGLIEEMVTWGTKVKDIAWALQQHPDAEKYAKRYYKEVNVRPPNGVPGSATSPSLRTPVRMQYAALACAYLNAIEREMAHKDAALAVFRLHWQAYQAQKPQDQIKSSVWLTTARNLDCGIEELVTCGCCGGKYLLQRHAFQEHDMRCMWCNHAVPHHAFRVEREKALKRA